LGPERIPVDAEQMLRINYVGPPGSFRTVSFLKLLDRATEPGALPDPQWERTMVILGVTARSQQDFHATPFGSAYFRRLFVPEPTLMSGAEIQAHIVATLADRAYVTTPVWLTTLPWLLIFGPLLGLAYVSQSLKWGTFLFLGHHFAWKAFCWAGLKWGNWHVEMVPMLLLGAVAYTVTYSERWRWQRQMMALVKSEAVARELERNPEGAWRGQERELTVLFSDIRDFTTFSESHTPEQVVQLLKAYFSAVVPVLESHGGVLDKYMGDGMMVLFGAPAPNQDHAEQAVRAAVAMVQRVHSLRAEWSRLDNPQFRIGIGIHTGKVITGLIGAPRRLDYTAIGDAVNTASRIEAENKRLETEVLISAATYQHLRMRLSEDAAAQLGVDLEPVLAAVKGKQESLLLHPVHARDLAAESEYTDVGPTRRR
ncbi:MAG TPA: adenylate/guanylate cyclase domain-containing protein, partial [Armatimonadota bacterium]|nr:adenylate/guanylate cyclase domain-containing protein [Armatimonadota bacterium]